MTQTAIVIIFGLTMITLGVAEMVRAAYRQRRP